MSDPLELPTSGRRPRQSFDLDDTGFNEVPKRFRRFYRRWRGPGDKLAPNEALCPVCKVVIRSTKELRAGERVYCMPACRVSNLSKRTACCRQGPLLRIGRDDPSGHHNPRLSYAILCLTAGLARSEWGFMRRRCVLIGGVGALAAAGALAAGPRDLPSDEAPLGFEPNARLLIRRVRSCSGILQ